MEALRQKPTTTGAATMDLELLIACVQEWTAIWQNKHKSHLNREVLDKYWDEIASALIFFPNVLEFRLSCIFCFSKPAFAFERMLTKVEVDIHMYWWTVFHVSWALETNGGTRH